MTTQARPSPLASGGLLLVALSLSFACAASPEQISVSLTYAPTSTVDVTKAAGLTPIPRDTPIYIAPIVDRRELPTPHLLGLSEEEEPDVPVYAGAGGQVPTELVRDAVSKGLAAMGLSITADPSAASYTLQIELDQFWIVEGSTFQATVAGRAAVASRDGAILWQGQVAGRNSRWGRTHETENFLHALSDASLEVAERLAVDPGLRSALTQ
ncbi:MAG: hypothetical protein R3B09_10410 [Nannocystaceae bacterium]